MRRLFIVVVVLLFWSLAAAKPLPKGLEITLKKETLYAKQNGITVPLRSSEASVDQFADLKGATLSDDGATIQVKVSGCSVDSESGVLEVPLAAVEARLENAAGVGLHVKKKYADASARFAVAVQKDPATAVYATNLLSAQSMGGKLDDADKTIAALAKRNLAWLAWRVAVDSDLAAVKSRPSVTQALTAKPSQLTWKKLGRDVAVNPQGLIAVGAWQAWGGPGAPNGEDLAIYDAAGTLLLRLPVMALADACGGQVACTKAMTQRTAANTRVVDNLLGALGFEVRAVTWLEQIADGAGFTSKDKTVTIEFDETKSEAKLTRGKATQTIKNIDPARSVGIAGTLIVLQDRETFSACDGDAQRSVTTFARAK